MATVEAKIKVKRSAGVRAVMLWVSLADASAKPIPIRLVADEGKLLLSPATAYILFYQFHGGPGQTLSVTIATDDATLLEIKESKVTRQDFQAGARPFTT